jgi:hypothetical protein
MPFLPELGDNAKHRIRAIRLNRDNPSPFAMVKHACPPLPIVVGRAWLPGHAPY